MRTNARQGIPRTAWRRFETEDPNILAETKTSFGRRNIALTNAAIKALRAYRAQQYEARLKMGDAWNDRLDLVFPNEYRRFQKLGHAARGCRIGQLPAR
jgi:hypothetical protein